jgi:3',5'-cyclic-AMP phosphodiesterase
MTRIIQITDLHINKLGQSTDNVDTPQNFQKVLAEALTYKPDHIILTGDLCHQTPSKDIYFWFKDIMDTTKIPYDVIPGNHDNSELMAEVFGYPIDNYELYYQKIINGQQFLFLDSSRAVMSENQYQWLNSTLQNTTSAIFMHHPPREVSVPHMDINYMFKQTSKFETCINNNTENISIFTGHCHNERTILADGYNLFVTPSCFVQISDLNVEFAPDHFTPGYRIIDFTEKGIVTYVRYLWSEK